MSALSRLAQPESEGWGNERQTPVDGALGLRAVPASGRALATLAMRQGRVY
jgi:hypothetical protein